MINNLGRVLESSKIIQDMQNMGYIVMKIGSDNVARIQTMFGDTISVDLNDPSQASRVGDVINELRAKQLSLGLVSGEVYDPRDLKPLKSSRIRVSGIERDVQTNLAFELGYLKETGTAVRPASESVKGLKHGERRFAKYGASERPILSDLQRRGYRAELYTFNPSAGSTDDVEDALARILTAGNDDGRVYATMYQGSGGISILRVGKVSKDGTVRYLHMDEIHEILGIGKGARITPSSLLGLEGVAKQSKRLRGVMQSKILNATVRKEKMKVALYDPLEVFKGLRPRIRNRYVKEYIEKHSKYKGATYRSLPAEIRKQIDEAIDNTLKSLADGVNVLLDAPRLKELIKASTEMKVAMDDKDLQKQVLKKLEMIGKGGVANIRVSDFVNVDIDGGVTASVSGTIKGNMALSTTDDDVLRLLGEIEPEYAERFYRLVKEAREKGALMLVPITNVGTELGADPAYEYAHMTISPLSSESRMPHQVRTNVISLSAHPDLIDEAEVAAHSHATLAAYNAELKRGHIPKELMAYIEQLAEMDQDALMRMPAEAANRMSREIDDARAIIAGIKSGIDISSDPELMSLVSTAARNKVLRPGNQPRLVMPDAAMGYFVGDMMAKASSKEYAERSFAATVRGGTGYSMFTDKGFLKKGYVTYSRELGQFVISDASDPVLTRKLLRLLGGADFDDQANFLFRYDKKRDVIKLLGFRDPTAMGERVLFNMGIDDPALIDLIEAFTKDSNLRKQIAKDGTTFGDILRRRRNALKAISGIRKEMKEAERKIAEGTSEDVAVLASSLDSYGERIAAQQEEVKRIESTIRREIKKILKPYKPEELTGATYEIDELTGEIKFADGRPTPHFVFEELEEAKKKTAEETRRLLADETVQEIDIAKRAIMQAQEGAKALAETINYMTFIEMLFNEYSGANALIGEGEGLISPKSINMFFREHLIDLLKQETPSKEVVRAIESKVSETGYVIGKVLAERAMKAGSIDAVPKLPYYYVNSPGRMPQHFKSAISKGIESVVANDPVAVSMGLSFESFVSTPEADPTKFGAISRIEERLQATAAAESKELTDKYLRGTANLYTPADESFERHARDVVSRFRELWEGNFGDQSVQRALGSLAAEDNSLKVALVNDEIVRDIYKRSVELAESTGKPIEQAFVELGRTVRSTAFGIDVETSGSAKMLKKMLSIGYSEDPNLPTLSTVLRYSFFKGRSETLGKNPFGIINRRGAKAVRDYLKEVRPYFKEETIRDISGIGDKQIKTGAKRFGSRAVADDAAESLITPASGEMIGLKKGLKELWDIRGIRIGTYAAAAVVAASAIYRRSKDRTEEEILVNPDIPESVEGGLGTPQYIPPQLTRGVSYQVRLVGGDVEYFNANTAIALGTDPNTTIYEGPTAFRNIDVTIDQGF